MTNFRFALQKVLDWRRTQLELEEAKFGQTTGALAAVDRTRDELKSAAVEAEAEVRRRDAVPGRELHTLGAYRLHLRAQDEALATRRAECVRQVAAQQAAMLEARRRCRPLERLRDRRLAEWTAARDHELEALAAESYMAQWRAPSSRRSGRPARL